MLPNDRNLTSGDPQQNLDSTVPDHSLGFRSVELMNYAQLLPWSCLAILLTAGLRTQMFFSTSGLSSDAGYLIWSNRLTAIMAIGFGLFSIWRLRQHPEPTSQLPELCLGAILLVPMAFINAALLIETDSILLISDAIITMIFVAFVFPHWSGLLVVTLPQLLVVAALAQQQAWAGDWLFAFMLTLGAVILALLGYSWRQRYTQRHRAALADRTRKIEALQAQAIEGAVAQERALNERNFSTLGRLAGGIAHDLNNILVPILGNASMLEEHAQTSSQKQQAREVMTAASRARSLTQQLGYFAARDNTKLETIEINSTLAELAPIVWRTLPQGVDITLRDSPKPVYLTVNRMALQDLVTNLLLDAGNATPIGGSVTLKVFPRVDLPVELAQPADQNYCAISIRDGAETLSGEEQSQLLNFNRMYVPERTRGLGLRSARVSAELLGGTLTIQDAVKGGNQFCLFLPTRDQNSPHQDVVNKHIHSAVAAEVLVVDDEPAVRNVSVQILERAGFVVRSCHSGEASLREIEGHLPDVIVMDLRMPGMGGRLAAEAIRKQSAKLPIIFCTGFAGDAQGWLQQMPNCALLQKPYEAKELIRTVRGLLHYEIAKD